MLVVARLRSRRLLGLGLSLGLGACAPVLELGDCRDNGDCPVDRPLCVASNCMAGPGAETDGAATTPDGRTSRDGDTGDAGVTPPDARVVPRDAAPPPGDAAVSTPDATVPMGDALGPMPDALVATPDAVGPPQDAFAPTPDAFVSTPDALAPTPDAFVSTPDAAHGTPDAAWTDALQPAPDAFAPPVDAFVPQPDACVPMPEICNGLDDNCDGVVDNTMGACLCVPGTQSPCYDGPAGTENVGVCHGGVRTCLDSDHVGRCAGQIQPVDETCNGLDDDCDGTVDDGVQNVWYADADGDSYGAAESQVSACTAPPDFVARDGDCNDGDGAVHPGAIDICNLVDDNCDGHVDELGVTTWYVDTDGDGWGTANRTVQSCQAVAGFAPRDGDCVPLDNHINPGAREICNGVDDNCDNQIDNNANGSCLIPQANAVCQLAACVIDSCHLGWDNVDRLPGNGCERGCDAVSGLTDLGQVPPGFTLRPVVAGDDRTWGVVIADVPVGADFPRPVLVINDLQHQTALAGLNERVGQPALLRVPGAFVAAVRNIDAGDTIDVWSIPDVGANTATRIPAGAVSDPALAVSTDSTGTTRVFLAFDAVEPRSQSPMPYLAIGNATGTAFLPAELAAIDPDALPLTPALAPTPEGVLLAYAIGKNVQAKLNVVGLDTSGRTLGSDSVNLPTTAARIDLAVRGNNAVAALTPSDGGTIGAVQVQLRAGVPVTPLPVVLLTRNILNFPPPVADGAVAATPEGFVVAESINPFDRDQVAVAGADMEMRFLRDERVAFAVVGPADRPLAAQGVQNTHTSIAWTGSALSAAWIRRDAAGDHFMHGTLLCH